MFLLIGLLAVISYYPGLSGDYVFDDAPNLLENGRLDLESLNVESLQGAALSSGSGWLRRPVSMFSFALNRYFFGIAPYSHKLVNLVIHVLTGFGLFLLTRQLISSYQQFHRPALSDMTAIWMPVVVSGLWLVHPLNLTSVLYIVQRMTSLSTLFMVFGLCLYVFGRQRMLTGKPGLPLILTGLVVCGGLAILSKETGALLPLYMLVLELTLFRFRNSKDHFDKAIIAFFILVVMAPACLFIVYMVLDPATFLRGYDAREFTLADRLLTEARVLVFYLKMIIMPSITELGLYHDDFTISSGLMDPPTTLFSLVILAGLILGALMLLRKKTLISLGILWFFTGHLLESTILPLEIAHEHRNYLADYGILLAASSAVAQAPLQRLAPVIRTATPFFFLLGFTSTTWLRSDQWSDNVNHAVYEAKHHPESYRAVYAAGRIYANLALRGFSGHEEKAFDYLEQANKLDKRGIMPNAALIKISHALGHPVKQRWFDEILDKLSRFPLTPANVDSLRLLVDCMPDPCEIPHEMMEEMFNLALDTPKQHPRALTLYAIYKINHQKEMHKGLELFYRVVELEPKDPIYRVNLIELLTVMGKLDEAEQQLALFKAISTHGGNATDYRLLQEAIDSERSKLTSTIKANNEGNI